MASLPNALRAGTTSPDRPDARRSSTNDSRLSDLLSSRRRSSAASVSGANDLPSRYGSIRRDVSPPEAGASSPLTSTYAPSRSGSMYSIPEFPALPDLPSLGPETSYEPLVSSDFVAQGRQHSEDSSASRGIIGRIASVRGGRLVKRGKYGPLTDLDEETEIIDFDVSGLTGPSFEPMIELSEFSKPREALVSSHALGAGMGNVFTAKLKPSPSQAHRRGQSLANPDLRSTIQREAEKKGEIIALEEVAAVDLSGFDGGQTPRSSSIVTTLDDGEKKKSYFFPEDPVQPSWRPYTMRPSYIILLVLIALALGTIQEVLCQFSLRKVDGRPQGLLAFKQTSNISIIAYFTWKYLPTMILVTYAVMWQIVDYEVKRLEPYYQLSKKEGATAKESLNLDYLTAIGYLIPFRAFRYKQWAVLCSSLASIISGSLFAVLQSASITADQKQAADNHAMKRVLVQPVFSRSLSAALGLVAILGIALVVALRRKSGLLSDPKGIAGVASMATKSHILADFRDLDTASNNIIHKQLRRRKYNLHKSSLWQGEYITSKERQQPTDKKENPQPTMLRLWAGIPFIFYMVLVAVAIPVFVFNDRANNVTDKIPFLLTVLATGVKLGWGAIDIELRVMEPYYVLSRRKAPPSTLTLDYTGTAPGWLTAKAIMNRHWIIAIVSFGAILTEVLTVCATSLTVDGRKFVRGRGGDGSHSEDRSNTTETFKSFWVSFALASGILCYLVAVACIVALKRHRIFLPRQPGSLAGVLAYIHQSKMLDDFVDTEKKNSREMTRHLEKIGRTYALGWFTGRDNKDHCGVDAEQIAAPYKHGDVQWKNSRMVGEEVGGWQLF